MKLSKLSFTPLLFILAYAVSQAAPLSIQAYNLNGSVRLNGKIISAKTAIKSGDKLSMEKGSAADIRFSNGTLARLKEGELVVKEAKDKIGLRLNYGKLYSSVKPGTQYEVASATAAAGVRGTQFFFEEQVEKKKSYICVCHGSVWVQKPGEKTEKVVKAGEDLWVKQDAPMKNPVVNPQMSMMTVEEIKDLEDRAISD